MLILVLIHTRMSHNIVFQFTKNKMKEEIPVIREAVEFFLDELFKRCTIDYRLNVRISFRAGHVKAGKTFNEGLAWEQEEDGVKWYVVQLNMHVPFLELLSTLAHELVHVTQFATRRLVITDDDEEWIWEGVNYGVDPYTGKEDVDTRLPWEYDAYSKETDLARKFVKKFYSNW